MRPTLLATTILAAALVIGPAIGTRAQAETVVVAVTADPEHLNPAITTGSHTHTVADSLFNGLTARDRDNRPIPDLAERWEISEDGTVYTFHLAEARWHDGAPVTADDVVFTFEDVLLTHHARTGASLRGVLDAVEARDDRTVVVRLSKAYAPLLQQLDVTEAPILPRHVYSGGDILTHDANFAPVGSGPFRFVAYERDNVVTLERNPDYFKDGLPHIERLAFRILPDARTQLLALQAGEVDVLRSIGGADARVLEADPNVTVESVGSGPGGGNCIMTVVFNLDREVWQDLRVRRAFAFAIERERMVEDILFGRGRVAAAPIASGIAWAHDEKALADFSHDPDQAAALLDEAGLEPGADGVRLAIDMVHFPQFQRYADAMRQDLEAVGVALTSRPLDRAATIEAIYMQRDFDTGLVSYCNGLDPEIGVRRMYATDAIGPVPFSNGAGYSNPEVDSLFAAAVATTDLDERGAIYARIQEKAVADLPYWWLVETDSLSAWRADLDGFTMWSGQFAEEARRN